MKAVMVRGDGSLPGDRYRCSRCGHEGKYSCGRGKPELCRDCRELRQMEDAA